MKIPRRMSIVLLLLFTTLLAACGGAPAPAATSQLDVILTEGVKTMVAAYFGTQTAMAPQATATSATLTPSPVFTPLGVLNTPVAPTMTPTWPYVPPTVGTLTVTVTGTLPTATVNSTALAYGCNNLAFITDVNYPSGTVVQPGENFTKTWKVANTGTCDWLYVYRLNFLSGTNFDAPSVNLGRIVTVNHWAEISVNLDAPRSPGTYSAYWRMSDGDGHMFGATLGVTIKVAKPPTDTPEPTAVPPKDTPGTPSTVISIH